MKYLYYNFLAIVFLLLSVHLSASEECSPNVAIGGIINSYGAVSNISDGGNCSTLITVDDASGFMPNDFILVIQMQGATINESNSSSFGDITDLGSAGLFEKAEILSINSNVITTSSSLLNDYQMNGQVQIVSIPQYVDAEVTSELTALPWNGIKGGVLALEVSGILTLQADINASETGFRGGTISNPSSECVAFIGVTGYHYAAGAWESEGKGEGVATYIVGKEYGRGAQANGGGGGNDHNAGGGGGAGFGSGGEGGENLEPSIFGCDGSFPGIGGKAVAYNDDRLFLGGGGGAGHDNNGVGTIGALGGGIVFINATDVVGNGNSIKANGQDNIVTTALDGGGGGGGGGSVYLDAGMVTGSLNIETKGGKGSDTNNNNQDRCMGPGGGGGGGFVYTNLSISMITLDISGGVPGIVSGSSNSCNGSTNNAQPGQVGSAFSLLNLVQNPGNSSSIVSYSGCVGDGYSVNVNVTNYNEALPNGIETIANQFGCDSIITVDLDFLTGGSSTLNETLCQGETLMYNGTEYSSSNPTGTEVVGLSANGCDSTVMVTVFFSPAMSISENTNGNDVSITVAGGTQPLSYAWSNGFTGQSSTLTDSGDYTVTVTDAIGCTETFNFSFIHTSNEEIKIQYGLNVYPNPTSNFIRLSRNGINENWKVKIMNIAGQQLLFEHWGQTEEKELNLSEFSNGIHILQIYSDEFIYSEKIIIEN